MKRLTANVQHDTLFTIPPHQPQQHLQHQPVRPRPDPPRAFRTRLSLPRPPRPDRDEHSPRPFRRTRMRPPSDILHAGKIIPGTSRLIPEEPFYTRRLITHCEIRHAHPAAPGARMRIGGRRHPHESKRAASENQIPEPMRTAPGNRTSEPRRTTQKTQNNAGKSEPGIEASDTGESSPESEESGARRGHRLRPW